jgi:hypothetical protein
MDLQIRDEERALTDITSERLSNIISRSSVEVGFMFKGLDDKAMAKIEAGMPAIHRATNAFGKTNTQISRTFKTLPMNSCTPYKWMRQCLAELESRRVALKDASYNLAKDRNKYDRLKAQLKTTEDEFDQRDTEIEVAKIRMDITDSRLHYEAALKEVGHFINLYNEIRESAGIPENWDEKDFEEEEIKEQIHFAFRLCVDDVQCHTRIGKGTVEQMRNFGINPTVAEQLVKNYLTNVNSSIQDKKLPDITSLYKFLDQMYDIFRDEYKKVMKHMGIKNSISEDYLYLEDK